MKNEKKKKKKKQKVFILDENHSLFFDFSTNDRLCSGYLTAFTSDNECFLRCLVYLISVLYNIKMVILLLK